jgi:hypothetical protein
MVNKRYAKIGLIILPVLLWDAFYFVIKNIYNVATLVDEKGQEYIDNFLKEK